MSSDPTGNSIRVRFSRNDEESSAILMRSESTIENSTALLNAMNDRPAEVVTDNNKKDAEENSTNDPNVLKAKEIFETVAIEPMRTEAESGEISQPKEKEDAEDCSSMDSFKADILATSTCRVIRQEKQFVLETPAPVLISALTKPSLEVPNFADGFTLEALIKFSQDVLNRYRRIPFFRFRLFFIAFLIGSFFVLPGFLSGLVAGIYISMIVFLFVCVSDSIPDAPKTPLPVCEKVLNDMAQEVTKEEKSRNIYKGWMNILNEHYSPHTFHVNTIQTVLVRLDGNMLRISRPERSMLKHTFHTDPTLTEPEPRMISQSIYDLTNATIKLRPRRLARRRWFSRKYPICILLNSSQKELFEYPSRRDSSCHSTKRERGKSITSFDESIGEEDNKSQSSAGLVDSHTITEIGREADGYISDSESETIESEDEIGLQRSASDCNIRTSESPKTEILKTRKHAGLRSKSTRNIYLFARSAREKERWFHKLRRACGKYMLEDSFPDPESSLPRRRIQSMPAMDSLLNKLSHEYFLYILHNLQFLKHIDKIIGSERSEECLNGTVLMDLGRSSRKWQQPKTESSPEFIVMVNLIASRIFYDFCRDEYWCKAVQDKIQSKLATIHLPYFIETLELSKFDIGTAIPRILKVYAATVDEWGIWVDFEIRYEGLIKLIIETKVNLMKLKEQSEIVESPVKSNSSVPFQTSALRSTPSRYSDEDIPESPETSPDEDFGTKLKRDEHSGVKKKTGKKILNIVDKITQSKFFKDASELKPIRKMMEEISSTRLLLNVEVTALEGIMTINLPPPPSDRLWYGFRKPPKMSAKAIPQVGDRSVVLSTVSDWIENKIHLLLEKNLVSPNLDDVVIPVLSGNELLQGPLNK